MNILGISALYHDSAAAIINDSEIIAAAQEERFTRKKADSSIPVNAIRYCLSRVGGKVDQVVFYDNPLLTMDRWLTNLVAVSPDNEKMLDKSFGRIFKELWIEDRLKEVLGSSWPKESKLLVCEHHVSHAASAFYPSPFEDAAILTIDGVGEWATTTIGRGEGSRIQMLDQIDYPDSLGLLYSAFTYFCGFKVNFGEYKLMGLAPYGKPVYKDLIFENLISSEEDGTFRLNQDYFTYMKDDVIIGEAFEQLFRLKKREPESKITRPYMDIAASIQAVTEDLILKLSKKAKNLTNSRNLVMAGGTALNCVANGKILESGLFDHIWIQPAAGDAGGALGCALYAGYNEFGFSRQVHAEDSQKGTYLGPSYTMDEVEKVLKKQNAVYHVYNKEELITLIAEYLADNKVVGIHHGAMEFGPRALGNRSILGNPMSEEMQSKLNLKIKFRESFRPFAPAVLEEDTREYFDLKGNSPYMLLTAPVKKELRMDSLDFEEDIYKTVNQKRSKIPAVTHVDYSARIQTVHQETNPFFYELIKEFKKQTGCGVVVNTSFNVRGEPIVCSPLDSWLCFMRTNMDILVIENCLLVKEEQSALKDDVDWREIYELD